MTPADARAIYSQWPTELKAEIKRWADYSHWTADHWIGFIADVINRRQPLPELTKTARHINRCADECAAIKAKK